jgi:hypothetical protein
VAKVFEDIPIQTCQFHQVKIVTKYLTRRPKTEAGQKLREIALCLKDSNEIGFTTLNCLDGMFSQLKNRLNVHRGAKQKFRYKLIQEILKGKD